MILLLRILIIFLVTSLLFTNPLSAQRIGSPIKPGKSGPERNIGILFGLGNNFQSGSFLVQCPDCVFENGQRLGFTLGAIYEQDISKLFEFGFIGSYDVMGVKSTYMERENVTVRSEATQDTHNLNLLFEHTGEAGFDYFSVKPFIKWTPGSVFFARLALSGSFIISSNITHTKSLQDRIVQVGSVENVPVELESGGYDEVVEDGEFPDVNPFQLSINPMIGLEFFIGKHFIFAPVFEYSIPLTSVSEFGENFKINSWRFLFELKYHIVWKEGVDYE